MVSLDTDRGSTAGAEEREKISHFLMGLSTGTVGQDSLYMMLIP